MSDLDRQATGADQYEDDDSRGACNKCGGELEWTECWMIDCDEGYYDLYDEDPIAYAPGDQARCTACDGKGGHWHCPMCESSASGEIDGR